MALKRTTTEAAEYFRQQGCELLDEYTGCMDLMEYRCSCGKYSTISWNNFTKGKRCGYCAKQGQKKKRGLKEVQEMFRMRGCEFLDSEFKGIHFKHRYRCKCGREGEITFAGFHHQEQYCRECGFAKNRKEGHHGWKPDREKHRLDQLFRKKCYKALSSSLQAVGKEKVGHTSDMLGYGPKELQEHIVNHPNWDRCKDSDWHIDHIWPITAFQEHEITEVRLINCLENLQPLPQKENNEKWGHYDREEFRNWLVGKGFRKIDNAVV